MAGEDPEYAAWIRAQPCAVAVDDLRRRTAPCEGPVEIHHRTGAGMALRAHDHDGIPLCHRHHIYEFHGATGFFKGWDRGRRSAWQDAAITHYRGIFTNDDVF